LTFLLACSGSSANLPDELSLESVTAEPPEETAPEAVEPEATSELVLPSSLIGQTIEVRGGLHDSRHCLTVTLHESIGGLNDVEFERSGLREHLAPHLEPLLQVLRSDPWQAWLDRSGSLPSLALTATVTQVVDDCYNEYWEVLQVEVEQMLGFTTDDGSRLLDAEGLTLWAESHRRENQSPQRLEFAEQGRAALAGEVIEQTIRFTTDGELLGFPGRLAPNLDAVDFFWLQYARPELELSWDDLSQQLLAERGYSDMDDIEDEEERFDLEDRVEDLWERARTFVGHVTGEVHFHVDTTEIQIYPVFMVTDVVD
jgi:hypothetical protein